MKTPLIPQHVREIYRAGQMKTQVEEYLAFCHLKREIGKLLRLKQIVKWLAKNINIWKLEK